MNWVDFIESAFNGPEEYRPICHPPASVEQIRDAETRLGITLPSELVNFLLDTNGACTRPDPDEPGFVQWIVVGTDALGIDWSYPSPFLLIGNSDCGDVYGFRLSGGGQPEAVVSIWLHETETFEESGTLEKYVENELDFEGLDLD